MVVDDVLDVIHAAVTDFNGVAVEDFSEFMIFVEVFVYKAEESVSDVGANIFAEWGVVS